MSTAATTTEPVGYIVWHRAHRPRARWKKIATVDTVAEAVALIARPGDWWLRTRAGKEDTEDAPGLFDEVEA